MVQDPFRRAGDDPVFGSSFGDEVDVSALPRRRTSTLAVVSLVASLAGLLVCCIPGVGPIFGIVGIICSAAALVAIGRSRGLLGGKPAAIVGLVTGIIAVLLGAMVLLGVVLAADLIGRWGDFFRASSTQDYTRVRAFLTQQASAEVTDEQIAAFVSAYEAEVGPFVEMPREVLPLLSLMLEALNGQDPSAEASRLTQAYAQDRSLDVSLVPARFAVGSMFVVAVSSRAELMPSGLGKLENIVVLTPAGPVSLRPVPPIGLPGGSSPGTVAPAPVLPPPVEGKAGEPADEPMGEPAGEPGSSGGG